jgi:hypothetical protein
MITYTTEEKYCLCCNKPVKGRTDKKFCNDYCRNNYNNQLKSTSNNLVRNTNHALGKNRRILESIIPDGEEMFKIKKETMINMGYLFKYSTHVYVNKKGSVYYYCYDYGYLPLDKEWCLVVRATE